MSKGSTPLRRTPSGAALAAGRDDAPVAGNRAINGAPCIPDARAIAQTGGTAHRAATEHQGSAEGRPAEALQ